MHTKDEIRRFTYVSVLLAAVAFALMAWKLDNWEMSKTWPMRLSSSISLPFFFWIYFIKYGWRQKLLSWIAPRPNVRGTWVGHLESNWAPNQPVLYQNVLPIAMSIRQDFFGIVIKSFTQRAEGTSVFAQAAHRVEAAETVLAYIYSLRDEFSAGSGRQQGAGFLRVVRGTHDEMNGEYWTNTKTQGRLLLRRVSSEEIASYITAQKSYPASKWPRFS
ncbi:MAG: hypothetical protein KA175_02885 [Flavobacteriales bacterium]|nr:hypothetical protein [Flavobacteriales bacterium]MBP6696536.1 hypothetical protein [Flavobacteriales bacterium]